MAALGDVPEWGNVGVKSKQDISTSDDCGKLCDDTQECCSYEWSPTSKICNLNRECEPNAPKYQDYGFCQKDSSVSRKLISVLGYLLSNKYFYHQIALEKVHYG